jgi:hypothetical protein
MYATATVMRFIFLYLRNVDLYFIADYFTIFSINILIANVKDANKRNKIWHTFELFFIYIYAYAMCLVFICPNDI